MNEAMLQLVHRAIRADRSALRALLERYRGFTYALAFRQTHRFPQAQRVAQAAWPLAAARLPGLAEPERFLDLLAGAVEQAFRLTPAAPGEEADETPAAHSVLRTEKVQARRSLRQALAACPLPESTVFFLRFVEGLSLEEIAELYGVEHASTAAFLKAVCIDLAYRAGFAGPGQAPPDAAALPPGRREALGSAVDLAEGGVEAEVRDRLARIVQTDPDARREDEAVRTVLDLATRTFAAHRLAPEFVKEVLMAVPYAEPPRLVTARPPTSSVPAPPQDSRPGPAWPWAWLAALTALAVMLSVLDHFSLRGWPARWYAAYGSQPGQAGLLVFFVGGGGLALLFARPPRREQPPRLPPLYNTLYGAACGVFLALVWHLTGGSRASSAGYFLAAEFCAPLWLVAVLGLLGIRARLAMLDLERRTEQRLRRREDQLPGGATAAQPYVGQAAPATPAPAPMPPGDPPRTTPWG